MTINVPHLSNADIEGEATALLRSFEAKYGTIQSVATPLDEIIEKHLKLSFEIIDLGHPAILGQLDIQQNLIRINSSLDPYQDKSKEGRFNFTLAHEGGHQVLHRPYAEAMMAQPSLLGDNGEGIILCRMEEQQAPIETQADKFASHLLMPKAKVIQEFQKYTGTEYPVDMQNLIPVLRQSRNFRRNCFHEDYQPTDEQLLHHAFKEIAEKFKVSMQAMVVRLKVLGLLTESEQRAMF
jgi:Zn-dependent peptidase ImmA (M78 family)